MKKRILVAVGDCIYSKHAVKYVARISSGAKDITYTLFNMQPLVPRIFAAAAEKHPELKEKVDSLILEDANAAKCTVDQLKDLMVNEGIFEQRIEVVTEPVREGVAKDILSRGDQGNYDAIVIARKGLTPSRDFFIGTTAAKVIEHALNMPVWVASEEEASMNNILLAVDGSDNSLRVVEHVISMIGANPDLRVTLFHVSPHLKHYYSLVFERENPELQEVLHSEDTSRMERFNETARKAFQEAGFKASQVKVKSSNQGFDISTSILAEARSDQYGTVVIGRRGEREAFFTGRIAMRLVQKMSGQALWVVP